MKKYASILLLFISFFISSDSNYFAKSIKVPNISVDMHDTFGVYIQITNLEKFLKNVTSLWKNMRGRNLATEEIKFFNRVIAQKTGFPLLDINFFKSLWINTKTPIAYLQNKNGKNHALILKLEKKHNESSFISSIQQQLKNIDKRIKISKISSNIYQFDTSLKSIVFKKYFAYFSENQKVIIGNSKNFIQKIFPQYRNTEQIFKSSTKQKINNFCFDCSIAYSIENDYFQEFIFNIFKIIGVNKKSSSGISGVMRRIINGFNSNTGYIDIKEKNIKIVHYNTLSENLTKNTTKNSKSNIIKWNPKYRKKPLRASINLNPDILAGALIEANSISKQFFDIMKVISKVPSKNLIDTLDGRVSIILNQFTEEIFNIKKYGLLSEVGLYNKKSTIWEEAFEKYMQRITSYPQMKKIVNIEKRTNATKTYWNLIIYRKNKVYNLFCYFLPNSIMISINEDKIKDAIRLGSTMIIEPTKKSLETKRIFYFNADTNKFVETIEKSPLATLIGDYLDFFKKLKKVTINSYQNRDNLLRTEANINIY